MNRPVLIRLASLLIVGSAIALTIYYIAMGFPAFDRSDAKKKSSQFEVRKADQAHKTAKRACSLAPPDAVVLAPKRVSQHLVTQDNCPKPFFTDSESFNLRVSEKQERYRIVRYIEFRGDLPFSETSHFVDVLRRFRIRVVVMSQEGIRNPRVKQILKQSSFEKVDMVEKNHIWVQREGWREVNERDRRLAEQLCRHIPLGGYALAPHGVSVQLEKIGRCRSFFDQLPTAFAKDSFRKRLDLLENTLSADNAPTSEELAILDEVLESQSIGGIVLVQDGDGSRKLKKELRGHGFKLLSRRDYYRLWIRQDASMDRQSE